MKKLLFVLFFLSISLVKAQDYFPTNSGVKTTKSNLIAFINATIYVTPDLIIQNSTLLVKDGKVAEVGKSVKIPEGAKIIDLKDKTIYPSFIDLYSDFGIAKPKSTPSNSRTTQYEAEREGYYWNDHIRPETNPIEDFKFDDKKRKNY